MFTAYCTDLIIHLVKTLKSPPSNFRKFKYKVFRYCNLEEVRPSKKVKRFLVPARFIFWGRLSFFLLFVIEKVGKNKNQQALLSL